MYLSILGMFCQSRREMRFLSVMAERIPRDFQARNGMGAASPLL
jgi:hypothetical protein